MNTHFYETHVSSWLPYNPALLRGKTEDALIKMPSPCMFGGSVFVVSPHWCTSALYFWPRINIEMRIMHKSLHSDYVLPPFLLLPETASTVLYFSRWRCQLIHFQVLHKGDPFCLIPELSHQPLGPLSIHSVLFSSSATLPPSLLIWANRMNHIPWVTANYNLALGSLQYR